MRPTLRQLQYFVAIAETGRFGEAARQLNVSQSALSAQVADMEAGLGILLIERGRHGALLTPAGEQLLSRARRILTEVQEFRNAARQSTDGLSGRIQLGVLPSIGPYLLPVVVRPLHQKYPALRLVVREERTSDLEKGLDEGRLDTIISTDTGNEEAVFLPLFREQLWICAAPDDLLGQASGPVSLAELAGCSFLSLGQENGLSQLIHEIAAEAGAIVSTEYEGTSLDAVRQMAVMGAGIALLPSLYAFSEAQRDPEFVVRKLDHPLAGREIGMLWRKSTPLASSFQIIAEELKQTAEMILKMERSQTLPD